ncbi:hypothetical protein A6P54_12850 [Bacillus sp. MKU004]|nr:hypothetical protein A6P54_12850 [Bacillus sp. MKU004]
MKLTLSQNMKLWVLGTLLFFTSALSYLKYRMEDTYGILGNLSYILYLVVIILALAWSHNRDQLEVRNKWSSVFILSIPFFNGLLVLLLPEGNHLTKLSSSVNGMYIFLISIIAISIIQPKAILSVLNRLYFFAFIIGFAFLAATAMGLLGTNEILNENTRGFLITPFLVYLIFKQKKTAYKVILFIVSLLLLLYSDARTTLISFLTLPIMMYAYHRFKRPRLLYSFLLVAGLTLSVIIAYMQSPFFTSLLSVRDVLWLGYLQDTVISMGTFLFGTGAWGVEFTGNDRLSSLNAHHTFISLFHFNGLLILACYVLFIIFAIRRHSTTFTLSDGILYLTLTFQFLESNVPMFTFLFPSFIFLINLLINRDLE